MSPRPIPDPVTSGAALVVFSVATLASFFAAGYAIAGWLYDRLTQRSNP